MFYIQCNITHHTSRLSGGSAEDCQLVGETLVATYKTSVAVSPQAVFTDRATAVAGEVGADFCG